ncbi:DUF2268 domain-containing putative Zn-dependent protease [Fictibacillus terranigra]|uniref:DUF2268 domain-containing putative Zn-dependent protease n=1 Tax=Fictibacillus terranigra TaxID=3058424 RepID=A0ABT8E7A7_9BACL|nr:DUF2268 domain-containing putative Zn-dependent protease [Fictibacillus sp. CENA-BCM004]MDN4073798.1 DUF2268 domain-containing putative Zn-dependent protease [Fictibacillus sp. CENA-BCM004]
MDIIKALLSFLCRIALMIAGLFVLYLWLHATAGILLAVFVLAVCFIWFMHGFLGLTGGLRDKRKAASQMGLALGAGLACSLLSLVNYSFYSFLQGTTINAQIKKEYYQEALISNYESLQRRMRYLSMTRHMDEKNVEIYYPDKDSIYAKEVMNQRQAVDNAARKVLPFHHVPKVRVILYHNPLIMKQNLPPNHYESLSGMYVPKEMTIHLLVPSESGEHTESIKKLFAHEYAHHLIISYLTEKGKDNRDVPRWFEEGLAEYISYKSIGRAQIFSPFELVPFEQLSSVNGWEKATRINSPYRPYEQSYFAIDQLLHDYGRPAVTKLLTKEDLEPFSRVFEKQTGNTLAFFQARFLKDENDIYRLNIKKEFLNR